MFADRTRRERKSTFSACSEITILVHPQFQCAFLIFCSEFWFTNSNSRIHLNIFHRIHFGHCSNRRVTCTCASIILYRLYIRSDVSSIRHSINSIMWYFYSFLVSYSSWYSFTQKLNNYNMLYVFCIPRWSVCGTILYWRSRQIRPLN